MKNILYIGNKLKNHRSTISSMESLEKKLSSFTNITLASDKKNKVLRMIDMARSVFSNRDKLDLVFIDTFTYNAFYFAFIIGVLCTILKIKYIPIIRGGNIKFRLNKNPRLSYIYFSNSFLNMVPSIYHYNTFKELGYQTQYLPNSISIKNYKFKERSILSPNLLWVRSFHEIYNPQMAIEVLRVLRDDYKEIDLCMVGPDKDGSLQKCKDLSLQYGLEENIVFTGVLDKLAWVNLSVKYDIFINTTNMDNLPISVIEAMALGFPLVSTNAGGLKHLHKDGHDALLGDKNDAHKMASNVKNILKDSNLAKHLSNNARVKAEKFDWDEHIQPQWFDLIMSN